MEWARQQRNNSKWVVEQITKVTFFVNKLRGHPIGCGQDLPPYLKNNRGIRRLVRNKRNGTLYQDNLCFFRCLALDDGYTIRNFERATKQAFQKYSDAGLSDQTLDTFTGVTLEDVHDAE